MSKKKVLRNSLIILHIIFAFVGFFLFISNYRLSQKLSIQETLNKQLLLAKAGSLSTQNLITSAQNELSSFVFTFAKIDENAPIDKEQTRLEFISYMKRAQLPINGIAFYDETGKLSILENRYDIRIGEGQDFSQTVFIQWSKNPTNRDKTFISTPYIGTTGASVSKVIFIVTKPVYFGTKYKGTLSIRLLIDNFDDAYVFPLTSEKNESVLIVNKSGVLLAGNNTLLNQNLFMYAQSKRWSHYKDFMKILQSAIKSNSFTASLTFQYPKNKEREFLAGITRIDIPNTDNDLYMIVLTPKNNAFTSLNPIQGYGFVWLGFGLFITIVGSIVVILLQSF